MLIRCAKCHGVLALESVENGRGTTEGVCGGCGQPYRLEGPDTRETGEELHKTARYFALENGIDLPSALSVCLQLMTLDQVQDTASALNAVRAPVAVPTERVSVDEPEASAPRDEPTDTVSEPVEGTYDSAFADAVECGGLSQRQAFERGDRGAFAQRLIERHDLAERDAYEVADNRMSLLAAIRQRTDDERQAAITVRVENRERRRRSSPRPRWMAAAVVAGLLVVIGVLAFGPSDNGSAAEAAEVAVETDGKGRVVRVAGPDPTSVLAAYCRSRKTAVPLEPLGLMPVALESARLRVGVLRDPSTEPTALLAIAIRSNRDSARWVAGDGRVPLLAMRAPDEAAAMFASAPRLEGGER